MKKTTLKKVVTAVASFAIIATLFALPLFVSSNALAATSSNNNFGLDSLSSQNTGISTETDITKTIGTVIKWALGFLGAIAVVVIIYAGFTYTTSLGDPGRKDSAKNTIIYAVIGLIIVLISFVIVSTVTTLFG